MKCPRISMIVSIDVFHPSSSFVEGCLQQSRPFDDFEVIVVDAEQRRLISTAIDEVRTKTQDALNIQYLTIDKTSRTALNNFGVAQAKAGLIVFNANDFIPNPNYLDAHLRFHQQHPEPQFVGIGPGVFPDHQRRVSAFLRWLEDSGKLFGFSFTSMESSLLGNQIRRISQQSASRCRVLPIPNTS